MTDKKNQFANLKSFFFENRISIFAALVAIALTALIVRQLVLDSVQSLYICDGIEQRTVKTSNEQGQLTNVQIQLPYECNEILLNPNIGTETQVTARRNYLDSLNFELVDTCICPDKLELWRYSGVGDVDVIGVIQRPPTTGGVGLNYIFEDSTNYELFNDSFSSDNNNPDAPAFPTVKIAIVDTGVDITTPDPAPDPLELLHHFLWPNNSQPCNIPSQIFGVDVLTSGPPLDNNGHGTHVNGIVAGFPVQAGSNVVTGPNCGTAKVRLEILNVKFTIDPTTSGSLFQAVCALHYALKQRVEVINVSWGYLSDSLPKMMKPFLQEAMDSNVIIVAGLGNDGKKFQGPAGTLRFWPAGFSETVPNVISVGAADSAGKMAPFSNRGDINIMNVVAPGVGIVSTFPKYLQPPPQTGLAIDSGTSMSTAFVTRTVAMMIGKKKCEAGAALVPAVIKTTLINNANPGRAVNDFTYKHENVIAVPF